MTVTGWLAVACPAAVLITMAARLAISKWRDRRAAKAARQLQAFYDGMALAAATGPKRDGRLQVIYDAGILAWYERDFARNESAGGSE